MTGYTEKALNILKERGYRLTRPRKLVLETLETHEESLSPYDIRDILKAQGEHVDTVSIYRIIECLEENHLIHRLLLQYGKVLKCRIEESDHCDIPDDHDHCHHFLICKQCGKINEMHCLGMQPIVAQVSQNTGFKVENHHLEFVGLCEKCA